MIIEAKLDILKYCLDKKLISPKEAIELLESPIEPNKKVVKIDESIVGKQLKFRDGRIANITKVMRKDDVYAVYFKFNNMEDYWYYTIEGKFQGSMKPHNLDIVEII